MAEEEISFNLECVEKLLKSHMKETTKISKDGVVAAAEFLRLFVIEAVHRAHLKADNKNIVTAKDVQRIIPQLLLDF